MESTTDHFGIIGASSKHLARRLLTIGENRLELLMVEVQEERERLLHAILLALGVAVLSFLAGVALSVALVVSLWQLSPVVVLLVLAGLFAAMAGYLYFRFIGLLHAWQTLPATFDQLRKDRAGLESILE